ncbi:glycosyltransferase family 2 protein [Candidatus Woesearchaeota archaeon]|nr:glycosyltransferase family 2 protein [Candidatus Woesearchaeota archaeon]
MEQQNNVWIIIPAKNEEKHIDKVIEETKKYAEYFSNILVVDDGSSDNTAEIAEQQNVSVIKHIINLGKGAALKTGCDYAIKNSATIIIAMDADLQHEPKEIPNFLNTLTENNADIVFGYRKLSNEMPFILKFGNLFINKMFSALYNIQVQDSQSGYRCFTKEAYQKIRWQSFDYSMESEMIARAGKNKLKYKEIPIQTIYHDKYKGTTVFDGIKIVAKMIWWKISRSV